MHCILRAALCQMKSFERAQGFGVFRFLFTRLSSLLHSALDFEQHASRLVMHSRLAVESVAGLIACVSGNRWQVAVAAVPNP